MSGSQEQAETPLEGVVVFPIERSSQIAILSVSTIFIILPTLAVLLRCLARHISKRKLDASDYCIIVAVNLTNAYQAVAIVSVIQCGVGFHLDEIVTLYGPGPFTKFLKIMIPIQLLWATSLSFCKVSILLLYTKIFTMRLTILISQATGALIIGFSLATILSGLLICRPLALNWDTTLDGTCGDQMLSYNITGSLNLATDIIVLLLPLPYLWKLQVRLYNKVVLMTTFSLGICTVIISAFRLASIKEIDYADLTYNIPKALIFSSLEPSLGVTLACIPLLRPLLGRSKYTNNGATQYHVSNHRTGGVSGTVGSGAGEVQKDGFPVLDDDSSQYQLRALDGRHNHNTSVSNENMGNRRSSDGEDSNSVVVEGTMNQRITVQRSWLVSSS